MPRMKRLQISLEPWLDAALGAEAKSRGVSKAAVVRRLLASELAPLPPLEEDPLWKWATSGEGGEPGDSARVDERVRALVVAPEPVDAFFLELLAHVGHGRARCPP